MKENIGVDFKALYLQQEMCTLAVKSCLNFVVICMPTLCFRPWCSNKDVELNFYILNNFRKKARRATLITVHNCPDCKKTIYDGFTFIGFNSAYANTKDICHKIDCNNGFNGPAPPIMRIFTIQDMVTRHYVTYK